MDLQSALSIIMILCTALLWTKEFMAKEVSQWSHAHGIHWSYHVSHHPEATGLIEEWNGLLKMQLQHQLGRNTLQGWGNVLQKAVYTLNQCPLYGTVLPIARIHESRNDTTYHYPK